MQTFTSANTSINSSKLPAVSKYISWPHYKGKTVLDYGGGKYNNFKEWLKETHDVTMHIYDPYNRTEEENRQTLLECKPDLILCSNVLNVIDSGKALIDIIKQLDSYKIRTVYYIYEGDRSGEGRATKKDCYQRNQMAVDYMKYFRGLDFYNAETILATANVIDVRY